MLFPFLGYVVASTVLTAVAVLLTGLVNTATLEKGRHHPPSVRFWFGAKKLGERWTLRSRLKGSR